MTEYPNPAHLPWGNHLFFRDWFEGRQVGMRSVQLPHLLPLSPGLDVVSGGVELRMWAVASGSLGACFHHVVAAASPAYVILP